MIRHNFRARLCFIFIHNSASGVRRAEVSPFTEVGFPEYERSGLPEPADNEGITRRLGADQGP